MIFFLLYPVVFFFFWFLLLSLFPKNLMEGKVRAAVAVNGAISLIVFLSGYLNRRRRLISHVYYLLHSTEDFKKSLIRF